MHVVSRHNLEILIDCSKNCCICELFLFKSMYFMSLSLDAHGGYSVWQAGCDPVVRSARDILHHLSRGIPQEILRVVLGEVMGGSSAA